MLIGFEKKYIKKGQTETFSVTKNKNRRIFFRVLIIVAIIVVAGALGAITGRLILDNII